MTTIEQFNKWCSDNQNIKKIPVRNWHHLTAKEVLSIRKDRAKNIRVKIVAFKYGRSESTIVKICARRTWKHI